jgi:opacity protein-like surface antigen
MSRKALLLLSTGLVLAAAPALAAEQVQQQLSAQGGGAIVRGGAPLPEFHLNFLTDEPGRPGLRGPGGTDNLEIALTSPDNGVFRFLFSPRPQFGLSLDRVTGNRGYAGLTWNLFDSDSLFGNVGLAGSYDPGAGAPNDPFGRTLGPSLTLHGALELGYHIGARHSLSLSLDQGRTPDLKLNAETTDNLRLRYGLKF